MNHLRLRYLEFIARSRNPQVDSLMAQVMETSMELVNADSAQIFLFDGRVLTPVASRTVPALLREITFRLGDGLISECMDRGSTIVWRDIMESCPTQFRPVIEESGVRGTMAVPFDLAGESFGVLVLASKRARLFTQNEITAAELYVQNLSLALHHCSFFPEFSGDWVRHLRDGRLLTRITQPMQQNVNTPQIMLKHLHPPKGVSLSTLTRISTYLTEAVGPISRKQAAEALGLSEVTVGTYLHFLKETDIVAVETAYGRVGRPKYLYRLRVQDDSEHASGVMPDY